MNALLPKDNVTYLSSAMSAGEDNVMVKEVTLSPARLAEILSYDPEEGLFTWRVSISSRAQAGRRAGTWVRMRNDKDYMSITYAGRKMAAGQVAWCLQTGEWPDRSVFFRDEDPTNLKWENLKLADHKSERVTKADGKVGYRMSNEQIRHHGLRRYGLTITEYAQMFAAQGGVCAICKQPETAKIPGRTPKEARAKTRDLSVDHDHKTGAVRELLCNACNHILGESGDDADRLRAAADYLDRHKDASNVVNLERAS